jgi:hypothetical protein
LFVFKPLFKFVEDLQVQARLFAYSNTSQPPKVNIVQEDKQTSTHKPPFLSLQVQAFVNADIQQSAVVGRSKRQKVNHNAESTRPMISGGGCEIWPKRLKFPTAPGTRLVTRPCGASENAEPDISVP